MSATLVSVATGGGTGDGASGNSETNGIIGPVISANGRYLVFVSKASNLVANDTNGVEDVFLRDTQTNTTTLLSVNAAGTSSGNAVSGVSGLGSSSGPSMSADGRFVAFSSDASDLVGGTVTDGNDRPDIFVRDTQTNTTTLVTINSAGTASVNDTLVESRNPVISADGRFVAFVSGSDQLTVTPEGDGGIFDIFVKNLETGAIENASISDPAAEPGNNNSDLPSISADGRYVAFLSNARNLVPGQSVATGFGQFNNVYVRDTQTDTTIWASQAAGGTAPDGESVDPVISANGRVVAFVSDATNMVSGISDGNGAKPDVFLRDLDANVTKVVSVNTAGTGTGGGSFQGILPLGTSHAPALSSDGRFVAFASDASDLTSAADANGTVDVFVRDVQAGTTSLISVTTAGDAGLIASSDSPPSISADGRYVAFTSGAFNLAEGNGLTSNPGLDLFLRDRQVGKTYLISAPASGGAGVGNAFGGVVSSDGSTVGFASDQSDLVSGDSNGAMDVFVSPSTPTGGGGGGGTGSFTGGINASLPAAGIAGAKAKKALANITVTNGATTTTTGVPVELYFSTDATIDSADAQISAFTKKLKIKPGASKQIKFKIQNYPNLPAGLYRLLAKLGTDTTVASEGSITIAPAFIDLTPSALTVPASLTAGKRSIAPISVTNLGNSPATGTMKVTLTASASNPAAVDNPVVAVVDARIAIQPGATKKLRLRFETPTNLAAGTYSLVAQVNTPSQLPESEISNNTAISGGPFTVA